MRTAVLDGAVAMRRIRAPGASCADITVIATTAKAVMGDRGRLLSPGLDDPVARPVALEEFRLPSGRSWPEGGTPGDCPRFGRGPPAGGEDARPGPHPMNGPTGLSA